MVHPDTYTGNTSKGISLFAKRNFKKGEIIWIADKRTDKILSPATYHSLTNREKESIIPLGYLDSRGRFVMPGDNGKYVNHSCSPNCRYLVEFDNISIASRDIWAGEEITEDYRSYHEHLESFECKCGAAGCAGLLKSDAPFCPSLRLNLQSIAGLVLRYPQPLLKIEFEEKKAFLAFLKKQTYELNKSQNLVTRLVNHFTLELASLAPVH